MAQLLKRLKLNEFFNAYPFFALSLKKTKVFPFVFVGCIKKLVNYANNDFDLDYELKIQIPFNYPRTIPSVFILSGSKIVSYGPEGHFMDDNSLCFGVIPEILEFLYHDCTLKTLTNQLIVPFLADLEYWKKYHKYPFEARSHGWKGYLEYFREKFYLKNEEEIDKFLNFVKQNEKIGNMKLCPFGCGVPYRECQCKGKLSSLKRDFNKKTIALIQKIHYIAQAKNKEQIKL